MCPGASISCSLGLSFLPDQEEGVVLGETSAPRRSQVLGSGALGWSASAFAIKGPPRQIHYPQAKGDERRGPGGRPQEKDSGRCCQGDVGARGLFPDGWGPVEEEVAAWEPPGPPILQSSLPPFLWVNPFPAPPPPRLGLLNAFAETEAGAQPGAFVTECWAAGRGAGELGRLVSSHLVTGRRERWL